MQTPCNDSCDMKSRFPVLGGITCRCQFLVPRKAKLGLVHAVDHDLHCTCPSTNTHPSRSLVCSVVDTSISPDSLQVRLHVLIYLFPFQLAAALGLLFCQRSTDAALRSITRILQGHKLFPSLVTKRECVSTALRILWHIEQVKAPEVFGRGKVQVSFRHCGRLLAIKVDTDAIQRMRIVLHNLMLLLRSNRQTALRLLHS